MSSMAQKHVSAKSGKKKKIYYGSLQMFLSILRFICWPFGMATFKLPKKYVNEKMHNVLQEKWSIDSSINILNTFVGLCVSFMVLATYGYLADYKLNSPEVVGTTGLATGQILLVVINSWRMLSGIATAWTFTIRRENLAAAFNKLWFIDSKMRSIGKYPTYIFFTVFFVLMFLTALGGRIALSVVRVVDQNEKISHVLLDFFSDAVQFLIHFLVLLLFNTYVVIMYSRFGFVNDCVESLRGDSMSVHVLEEKLKKEDTALVQEKSAKTLNVVCSIYESLCYGGEDINAACTVPLFSIVIVNFTEGILLAYLYIFERSSVEEWRIIWTSYYFVFMLLTLLTTGMVKGQIQAVARHLAESDICYIDNSLSTARNIFLLQTLQHNLEFTACGCFPVTISDMFGQVGVCISLLLFLFQLAGSG